MIKTLKDYIDEILEEDSNMPVPTDSVSPLTKTPKKSAVPDSDYRDKKEKTRDEDH